MPCIWDRGMYASEGGVEEMGSIPAKGWEILEGKWVASLGVCCIDGYCACLGLADAQQGSRIRVGVMNASLDMDWVRVNGCQT